MLPSHPSYSSLSVRELRHRSFLQRVYGGVDRRSKSIHRLLPKKRRRIQQRVQECQTRSHRRRYRLCMDVGRDSGPFISLAFARSAPTSDAYLTFVCLGPKLQSSAVAYKYGISGPWWYGSGATVQVLLFAQVRTVIKMRGRKPTQTHGDPISFPPNLNSMPHTLIPGSRSLVLVGENLLTLFSSSSGTSLPRSRVSVFPTRIFL